MLGDKVDPRILVIEYCGKVYHAFASTMRICLKNLITCDKKQDDRIPNNQRDPYMVVEFQNAKCGVSYIGQESVQRFTICSSSEQALIALCHKLISSANKIDGALSSRTVLSGVTGTTLETEFITDPSKVMLFKNGSLLVQNLSNTYSIVDGEIVLANPSEADCYWEIQIYC